MPNEVTYENVTLTTKEENRANDIESELLSKINSKKKTPAPLEIKGSMGANDLVVVIPLEDRTTRVGKIWLELQRGVPIAVFKNTVPILLKAEIVKLP